MATKPTRTARPAVFTDVVLTGTPAEIAAFTASARADGRFHSATAPRVVDGGRVRIAVRLRPAPPVPTAPVVSRPVARRAARPVAAADQLDAAALLTFYPTGRAVRARPVRRRRRAGVVVAVGAGAVALTGAAVFALVQLVQALSGLLAAGVGLAAVLALLALLAGGTGAGGTGHCPGAFHR